MEMVQGIVEQFIDLRCPDDKHPDTWDLATLRNDILTQFGTRSISRQLANLNRQEMADLICRPVAAQKYQEKEDLVGRDVMRQTERIVMLQVIDNQWKDHLLSMDELKQGIGNRAYGQKDPLVEYKKESYELFTAMMDRIEDESVRYLYFLQVNTGSGSGAAVPRRGSSEEDGRGGSSARPTPTSSSAWRRRPPMEDFTRNIERKKDRELEGCNFGGDGSTGRTPVSGGRARRAATIPALAAAARSTRSATAPRTGLRLVPGVLCSLVGHALACPPSEARTARPSLRP